MNHLTFPDRGSNRADTPLIEPDTRPLGHIVHDRGGGGVDRVQGVSGVDEDTRTELTGGGAYSGQDRGRQRELEGAGPFIEGLDQLHTTFFTVLALVFCHEDTRHSEIHDLGGFVVSFFLGAITQEVFASQLAHTRQREVVVSAVVDDTIQVIELAIRVVVDDVAVIDALGRQALDDFLERWGIVTTIHALAEIIRDQAGGHTSVVRRLFRDHVLGGFYEDLLDALGCHTVVEFEGTVDLQGAARDVETATRVFGHGFNFRNVEIRKGTVPFHYFDHLRTLLSVVVFYQHYTLSRLFK